MAVNAKKRGKNANMTVSVYCRNCVHSGNRFELNVHHQPFMCWCPKKQWAQFLNYPQICKEYKEGDPIPNEPDPFTNHTKK